MGRKKKDKNSPIPPRPKKKSIREQSLLSERAKKFDPSATQDDCIKDLRKVQEAHPFKYITRNFYRINGKYSDSTWNRYFGTFQEFKKQSGLELSRNQQKLERDIAKHASLDVYREFFQEEVLPYRNKYQKPESKSHIKTFMVCSDLHDIEVDEFCLSVFIDQCRRIQPDYIIFNGDIFDCFEFSKYTSDPREMNIKERFEFVHTRVFSPLRKLCPNAQMDFIMGNHEFRLLKHIADKSPNIRILLSDVMDIGFSEIFGLDKYNINWISKLDFAAYNKSDINKELKQNYKIYYECYAITHIKDYGFGVSGTNGHHHRISMSSNCNHLAGQITWVQTPGMHKLDAAYFEGMNNWNLGFLKVDINTKTKQVIQHPIHVHETWALVDGIYYEKNTK